MNDTNYPKIDEVSDATSYIDDTVKAGTKYYYLVRPVFNDGTAGEYSKPISGVALGKTNLTKIKAKSGKKITLTWKKVSKAEGYLIYRQDSSDSKFYQIGTVKSGSTLTYTDTVKSNNKIYTYKVTCITIQTNGRQGDRCIFFHKICKDTCKSKNYRNHILG